MLALTGLSFCLLLLLQWLLFVFVVRPQIQAFDSERLEMDLSRVAGLLADEQASLQRTVAEWAKWSELAKLVAAPSPGDGDEFLSAHPGLSLEHLNINGLIVTDAASQPRLASGLGLRSTPSQLLPWVEQLIKPLQAELSNDADAHRAGYLVLPSGELAVVAVYPIGSPDEGASNQGMLGMLRLIDANFLAQLSQASGLNPNLHVLRQSADPDVLFELTQAVTNSSRKSMIRFDSENKIMDGFMLLDDLSGQPIALIELQGGEYLNTAMALFKQLMLLTIFIMLVLLLVSSLLQSNLLSRLLQVTDRVRQISRSHDLSQRVARPKGNDEVVDLAEVVNRFLDTREEMALELIASEERFRQLTNNAPVFIWITDMDGDFIWLNDEMLRFVGIERELFQKVHVVQLIDADEATVYKRTVQEAHDKQQGYQMELRMRRHDGHYRWVLLRASPMMGVDGQVSGYAGMGIDINDRKQMEAKVEFLAHYDALTELPNRAQLTERLSRAIFDAHFNSTQVAVLFLDLDRFKNINDTLGHQVGDWLLQAVSQRLQQTLRAGDMVGRLGGDEFVVVLSGLQNESHIKPLVEKIQQALLHPYFLSGHQLQVTPSIGVSLYPKDSQSIRDLLRHADTAMYAVKSTGRNGYAFYDPSMDVVTTERLLLESAIRHGMDHNEFYLEYQPQVYGEDRAIFGVEALLRLKSLSGVVPPDIFIPVAEETGQIIELGEWVLREACRQAKVWIDSGCRPVVMAVNISAVQLQRQDLTALVKQVLEDTGLPARYLELEITERVIMSDSEALISTLQSLRKLGVRLALDDFGTGYSSLSYLKSFPFDVLKIDQSFIRGITNNLDDVAITEAIIDLATRLKLEVLAEGVETAEHVSMLLERGCSHMQGYNFSRPMKAADLLDWLKPD